MKRLALTFAVGALIGALFFTIVCALQKFLLGAPVLDIADYPIPFVAGALFGLPLSWLHHKACRDRRELRSLNANLAQDIRERTRELKEREQYYRDFFKNAPFGMFRAQLNGAFIEVNHTLADLLGFDQPERILGKVDGLASLMYAIPGQREQVVRRALNQPGIVNAELLHHRPNGQECHMRLHMQAIRDQAGDPLHLEGFVEDITQRKKAQIALRTSEQAFRTLFEAGADAMILLERGVLADANQRALQLFCASRGELLGKTVAEISAPIQPDGRDAREAGIAFAHASTVTPQLFEWMHKTLDGHEFMAEVALTALELPGRHYAHAVVRDISERKRLESELLNAIREAENANKVKSEFLAIMSHELRTPLNGIMGMLQLLDISPLDEEQHECVELADRSARGLLAVINDVLDVAVLESENGKPVAIPFHLRELVGSLVNACEQQIQAKGLELAVAYDPLLPEHVIGDPGRLRQILFHLLGNALKFSNKGRIRFDLMLLRNHEPERLLFIIEDQGVGIADEAMAIVFQPFTQADTSNTRAYGGAGLGLSIVRRLVERLGGSLAIESEEGVGTTVYMCMPFLPSPVQHKQPVPRRREGPRPLKLLVAEDEAINRLTTLRFLKLLGHEGHSASDGVEALEALGREDFDMVLMDIQMPRMDGVEATRRIREGFAGERQRNLPIIAMTAYAMPGDRELFLAAGMDDYLPKPLDMASLGATLQRFLVRGVG